MAASFFTKTVIRGYIHSHWRDLMIVPDIYIDPSVIILLLPTPPSTILNFWLNPPPLKRTDETPHQAKLEKKI